MSNSCNLIGRCRNRLTGKLSKKLSQLHRDLLNIGKSNKLFDREKANKAFFLSQSTKFLNLYDSELIFDSLDADAEPTLASFYEVARSVMPEVTFNDIRNLLAKKFGEGVYSYEDALDRMITFNKEMLGAHTFMGTIRKVDNDNYKFEITYNAIDEQNALMQTIADKNFADMLINKLQNLGINIEYGQESMYISDGVLGIIRLKEGQSVTADLAKETGHAIIGTLGEDHPLVKRLTEIAANNQEAFIEIIGQEEWHKIENLPKEKRIREVIGHAVGKYLEDERNISKSGIKDGIRRLIARMIDFVKTKFALSDREYKQALYDAKYLSYKAARDFLGENFVGTLDNALKTPETLNAESNILLSKLGEVLRRLDLIVDKAKDWGFITSKYYKDKFDELMTEYNEVTRLIKENEELYGSLKDTDILLKVMEQMIEATRFVINLAKEAQVQLVIAVSDIDPLSGGAIKDNEICKVIRKNEVLCNELVHLDQGWFSMMEAYTSGELDLRPELHLLHLELLDVIYGIKTENASASDIENVGYSELINKAREKLALRLLTKINGNQFLIIEKHVSMESFGKIKRSKGTLVDLKSELSGTVMDPPLSWFSRYITSMMDSPKIINLLVQQAIEEKKHEANILSLNAKDRLFELHQKLKGYGIKDTSIFMERTSDNFEYTGNIISERNWGLWEKNRRLAYLKWRDEWWQKNKHLFNSISEAYHDAIFLELKGAFLKLWHSKNSSMIEATDYLGNVKLDEEGAPIKCWAPAISSDDKVRGKVLYDGEQYNKLKNSKDQKDKLAFQWLTEYMEFKRELDSLLPPGSTNGFGVRAPQFLGTLTDKLKGSMGGKLSGGQHIKRFGTTSWNHYVLYQIAQSPSDTEYGGEHDTYNEEDVTNGSELIFTTEHMNYKNAYSRVPIYGVRKLKDLYTISTDLIHSTLAYAAMAYNYNCLDSIIDEVEVLRDQLKKLKVGGRTVEEIWNEGKSGVPGSYERLTDYMHLQVYNVYAPLNDKKTYILLRKGIGALSRYGSLYYLQFNLHSAITNVLTGLWEIVKESIGGEEFNFKEFLTAFGVFTAYEIKALGNNIIRYMTGDTGSDIESRDKMHLFLKMFDVLNENLRKFRDYHIQTPGYQLFRGYSYVNIAMFPYSVTDKWMQAMAYIATAKHTKMIDKNGNESTIWDAYEVVDDKLVLKKIKENGKLVDAEWKVLDKNLKKLNDYYAEAIKSDSVPRSQVKAVYEYDETALSSEDPNKLPLILDDRGNKVVRSIYVPWDEKAQTLFKVKCRGINNRMHGVYNSNDGGAFLGMILGPAIASLKKYAIGLIDRRFSRGRYDLRSRTWRQGSTVTIANLIADYMFAEDMSILKVNGDVRYKLARRAVNAVLGLAVALCIITSGTAGTANILRRRGYSEHLIANVRRFFADLLIPELLRCLLYIVAPPDEKDKTLGSMIVSILQKTGAIKKRENSDFDDDPWLPWLSEAMLKAYVGLLKASRHTILMPDHLTENDDYYLSEDSFYDQAYKVEHAVPFSVKGMLYYQIYRTLLEQEAYNVASPRSMFNLYTEYKNLTNSSIMGASSLYDTVNLVIQLLEHKDEKDLEELAIKEDSYKVYDKYAEGKEIYKSGVNKGYKKAAVHEIKVSPIRTGAVWAYGYTSVKNHRFWRYRAMGLEGADGSED